MKITRPSKGVLTGRLGTVLAVLLLASSANVYAQRDRNRDKEKEQDKGSTRPANESPRAGRQAGSAERPAPQAAPPAAAPQPSAQPERSSPRRGEGGGRQYSGQQGGSPSNQTVRTAPTPAQPSQPAGGQGDRGQYGTRPGGGRQYGGQPSQPTPQPTTQPTPQATTPNSGQGSGQPGSGRQYGRGTQPSQPTPQVTPQPATPNSGQGNRAPGQNVGGQPGSGRQFGGGGNSNPGQPNSGSYNSGRFSSNGGRPGAAPQVTRTRNGGEIFRNSNGNIREVRTAGGAVIHHAPDGYKRVEVARPGGRVIVANQYGHGGYVQRPLIVNNRTYVQRTYVYGGTSYARVYRPYSWGGSVFNVYRPTYYYRPAFYAYAYNPWARPVYYSWGWGATPWYGYYGGWFTPYPVYASPALWLTDYLIGRTLEDAYQARLDQSAAMQSYNYSDAPLTPEVKQAVADEVRRQLDQERAEQQNGNDADAYGPPPLFSRNGPQVFVVSMALSVGSRSGDCVVTEGDVLQLNGVPSQNSSYADVTVLASKGRDCPRGMVVTVALDDLQEMQNQMRATIDQGLGDLQSRQGQGGLPTLPPAAAAPPENVFGNQVRPDSNASSELSQAAQEAVRAERDVVNQSMERQGTPTISLGMTVAEVEQTLGRPENIANVGAKRIYIYRDIKVIFIDGRVTDAQ